MDILLLQAAPPSVQIASGTQVYYWILHSYKTLHQINTFTANRLLALSIIKWKVNVFSGLTIQAVYSNLFSGNE